MTPETRHVLIRLSHDEALSTELRLAIRVELGDFPEAALPLRVVLGSRGPSR